MEAKPEYQKAIDYMCTLMEQGKIKEGDKFPTERTIAEDLNISRNSTREALRVMESMGFLERRQGSGNYMTGNTSESIKHLIAMMLTINRISKEEVSAFRRQMEKAVCTSIIEDTDEDSKEELACWCHSVEQQLLEDVYDIETEAERDREFHFRLIEKTQNRFWIVLMDAVMDIYREWISFTIRNADSQIKKELKDAHLSILKGLQNRDTIQCIKAIDQHYNIIEQQMKEKTNEL